MIYLDNAATTYPKPEAVYNAINWANRELAFNAGRGSYRASREATKLIDETKGQLLKMVNAYEIGKIAFTPSITIALNEILQGIEYQQGDNIYVSPYEHNAVARVAHLLELKKQVNVIQIPVKSDTLEIDLEKLQYEFTKKRPKVVCCNHVSNVTGYVLPVEEIFTQAKKYNAITILDTAQSLGLIQINAKSMHLDYIAFTGHKSLYGPLGIGGFIDLSHITLNPVIVGGTGSNSLNLDMPNESPYRYESSSLNISAIAGLNAALNEASSDNLFNHEDDILTYLLDKISGISNIELYCPPRDKHVSVLSFNIKGYKSSDISEILDEDYDIAVRAGYHCAPYIHEFLKDEKYLGTVRVGIGRYTSKEDINCLIEALSEL